MNNSATITGRPLLLTLKAGAAKLGTSVSLLRTLQDRGTIKKIKLTPSSKGQVYVIYDEIEALARDGVTAPAPEQHATDMEPAPVPAPDPVTAFDAAFRFKQAAIASRRTAPRDPR
jgi:hypothetical protein